RNDEARNDEAAGILAVRTPPMRVGKKSISIRRREICSAGILPAVQRASRPRIWPARRRRYCLTHNRVRSAGQEPLEYLIRNQSPARREAHPIAFPIN